MKRIIVIPAYEPDDRLIKLLKNIDKDFDTVVVDDGSGGKYENIFKECKLYSKVISYEDNHGKGYALKQAFSYINDKYKDNYIVVCMDCDGQHKVSDAVRLCDYVDANPLSLVLGMRKRGEETHLRSRLGNGITMGIYRFITGVNVYDTQTGLRAFSNHIMNFMLSIPGDRFEYEMNMLLMAAKNNIKIHEIQIETIYFKRHTSHFKAISDSFLVYKELIKFSISSIICFIIDYLLFAINILLFNNINVSNIIARVISASANYIINRKMVFNSNNKQYKSLCEYIVLAICILFINTILLNIFVNIIGINVLISKIIVELILFIVSYIVQRKIIFKE